MKTISKILIFVSMSLALSGCDDFLTKEPETNLSPNTFFSSEAELELWTNRFYSLFAGPDTDAIQVSDIQIGQEPQLRTAGHALPGHRKLGHKRMGLPALHQLLPRTFGQLPRRDDPPALRRRGLFLPRAVLLRKGAQIRRHPLLRLRNSVERLGFAQTVARQPRIRDEEGHGGPRPRHHGPARQLAERRALPPEQKRRPQP